MKTSIIILTHNQLHWTKLCLESIRRHTREPIEIIVIDNASTDETVDYLKSQADVQLISNSENHGFPKGCNQGIEASSGDNLLFLNNDTIVTEDWLTNMLVALYSDNQTGMVGPVSNQVSGSQQIKVTYDDISGIDAFAKNHCERYAGQTRATRRLVGFCLLAKKSVIDEIGWFDERFGIGNWEDDDLCYRAIMAGYTMCIVMDSFVHHAGSATFSQLSNVQFNQILQENRLKSFHKWNTDIHAVLFAPSPVTISLCMIVRNDARVIARCLDSIRHIADEIIIVDTGSTDETLQIAARYTDRIYHFEWTDNAAAARNYAFRLAAKNYILWLDADDVLMEPDQEKLAGLKQTLDPNIDSVTMKHHLSFDANGNVTSSLRRNRLVKTANRFQWHGAVHEYLEVEGRIIDSDIAVTRMGNGREDDRSLPINENRSAQDESLAPRGLYEYADELNAHGLYDKAAVYYERFLATRQYLEEDAIAACGKLSDCYHRLGNVQRSIEAAMLSFAYGLPRAELCCKIGFRYLDRQDWKKAIYWFELATKTTKPESGQEQTDEPSRTWIPHLQLCVCYDRIGETRKAYHHHRLAQGWQPNHSSIQHNENYFRAIFGGESKADDSSDAVATNSIAADGTQQEAPADILNVEQNDVTFTGERIVINKDVKGNYGNILEEHVNRYKLACQYVKDKVVLDAACGAGYGSKMLHTAGAKHVLGVDIAEDCLLNARKTYATGNIEFAFGDVNRLELADASFDVVVSFETIEHIENGAIWIREAARLLKEKGIFIVSTPNRAVSNPGYYFVEKPRNHYHQYEYTTVELVGELLQQFELLELYGQTFSLEYGAVPTQLIRQAWQLPAAFTPYANRFMDQHELVPLGEVKDMNPLYVVAVCRKK